MIRLLILLTSFAIFACSNNEEFAGASTVETENASIDTAFVINVMLQDSTPVKFASAKIHPQWYVKPIAESDESIGNILQTDSLGRIILKNIDEEKVTIAITDGEKGVFAELQKSDIKDGESVTYTMQDFGTVNGSVELPDGHDFAWVQVFGTDRLLKTDKSGKFTIDSLAPANYRVRTLVSEDAPSIGEAVVSVEPNRENNAGNLLPPKKGDESLELWRYSRTIPLSEVASEWMLPLADTTVVFVRLDAENYSFEEAMANGNDLRFTDQHGSPLPSKIASWDDSLQNAKIMVRLNGTSDIESIEMFWGKTAALDVNDPDIWKGIPDSLMQALNSVTLIDFESGSLESVFEIGGEKRDWYFEPQDSNVVTTPSKANVQDGFEKDEERNGTVFHWKAETSSFGRWSMIGSRICKNPTNFSGLDSVTFYAKGEGELGFVFEVLEEPTGKVKYVDSLTAEWKQFSFNPDEFVEGDQQYGNMGWDFVKTRVTTVTIWIVDNGEIWLDDVRIYGINRDDLN